jgi:hypothetical protein
MASINSIERDNLNYQSRLYFSAWNARHEGFRITYTEDGRINTRNIQQLLNRKGHYIESAGC